MEKNDLSGFVSFLEDNYTVYTSADYEEEGMTLEYFMNKMMNEGLNASMQAKGGNGNSTAGGTIGIYACN